MIDVNSLEQFVQIVATSAVQLGTAPWWRGHSDSTWKLVPGAFRGNRTHHTERNMNARFRSRARTRQATCPSDADLASWLTLMQHYRLPTRLLDWSELPLVALFFATADLSQGDGSLWRLDPYALNRSLLGKPVLEGVSGPRARELISQAFMPDSTSENVALALLPAETDVRMMLQGSAFTIHDGAIPLEENPSAREALVGYRIPAPAKRGLRQHLELLGVRRSNLFPDLENLAIDVADMEFRIPEARDAV